MSGCRSEGIGGLQMTWKLNGEYEGGGRRVGWL